MYPYYGQLLASHLLDHVHVACQSRSCHHQSDEPPNVAGLTGPPVARQPIRVARHLSDSARDRAMRAYRYRCRYLLPHDRSEGCCRRCIL